MEYLFNLYCQNFKIEDPTLSNSSIESEGMVCPDKLI